MTNIFYRLVFYRQTIFTDFILILILILSYFRQLRFSGDIPLPFLVVKESKCLKNNNTRLGIFSLNSENVI